MIHFIVSDSYHIQDEEIKKIYKDKIFEIIDYKDSNLNEIINLCSYTSLFDDEKNIIVKSCDFLDSKSKENLDLLEKYVNNPNPLTNVVFLFNNKVDERKKVVKLLKERNSFIYIKPLNYKEINQKLINISKEKGYKLSESNASYITFASLNNYDIAYIQLEKIFLFYLKPCEILKSDLENLISSSLDDNNFKFIDAVIKKDVKSAMKLIKDFKLFKIEPIALITLLAREYRLILFTKDLLNNNYSKFEILKKLSLLDWQLDKIINNSYNYTIIELEDKLADLLELDYKLKTNTIDKYLGLEMFVLSI